ncbi:MAG TPA: YicC/YloC family endoribonuclease, partial [Bryobacteraceae bacterium]|nr:YicC/YloC family endoribonuclease [Bryobacteraceae bacterium]
PGVARSMTGFARAKRPWGESELAISVKSVNHRGLDLHLRGPESAGRFETAIRALVKSHVARGHVEIRISLPAIFDAGAPALNQALLDAYLKAFQEASAAQGLSAEPDLNAAFRIPGMFAAAEESDFPEGAEALLLDALGEALHHLNAFREREGAEIAAEVRKHNAQVLAAVDEMERIREGVSEVFQNRLKERLKELLNGAQIDPQRLAQEAAILAERSDIGEELARLKIHAVQLTALLDSGGETGKKLDFLLQEMNREANTVLSKTSGAGEGGLRITDLALSAKAAIEKIREQSLNLE